MTTENLNPESLDAPKPAPATPAGPPAGYLSGLDITDEMIEGANWRDKDRLIVARAQARETKRLADEKAKAESDASSKRAKDVVDEIVKKDKETPEEEKPTATEPGKPAFELEVPDTLTPSQREAATGYAQDVALIATEHQIPQEEATVIYETAMDIAATIMPSGEEPDLANVEECMAVMNNRWGATEVKSLVADAAKAVERLSPDVKAWLNTPNELGEKIGNSPAAVYALAMYQRGYTRMSPEKAAAEVARLRGLPQYQKGERMFTDHVALLSKIASRGQSRELSMPAKAKPAIQSPSEIGRAKLEGELKTLRLDAAYSDRYAANHKQVVARVQAIMSELHPEG